MLRKFRRDQRGNYAMMTAIAMLPIMGALVLAIDYTEMTRQRQATLNALDAANIAAAWRVLQGDSDEQVIAYAQDFFEANLGAVDPALTTLHVELPSSTAGGGTLKMSADLKYEPIFYPAFQMLLGRGGDERTFTLNASNEVRLRNTLEVALVLDNSGSMDYTGFGSGRKRMDLLKEAAAQLVDALAAQASHMQQVDKPVQFGIVPFSASVNVGPEHADAPWMDRDGRASYHHENFDWTTMTGDRRVERTNGVYYKRGEGWGDQEGQKVTRFTMFEELQRVTGWQWSNGGWRPTYGPASTWAGCVEMRPHPLSINNVAPNQNNPDTLFVPMFAPDETDVTDWRGRGAYNSWWPDTIENTALRRQVYMPKYFQPSDRPFMGMDTGTNYKGPNKSCTNTPITPLTDVSTTEGVTKIKNAINGMIALGATNVPEGTAWGWRVVSGSPPFTQGRPDHERGNDKVVIVLTDGANTYYTPQSLGALDEANNRSIYSNYGYAKNRRIFDGTSVSPSDFSNTNYARAMNQQMRQVCNNAKAEGIIMMTVALDLSMSNTSEREQIELLRECASESRVRRDPDDPSKGAKLFWNATGADLSDRFREIADELSNLRIVG